MATESDLSFCDEDLEFVAQNESGMDRLGSEVPWPGACAQCADGLRISAMPPPGGAIWQ